LLGDPDQDPEVDGRGSRRYPEEFDAHTEIGISVSWR
jgi:hypothetical protein